MRLLIMTSVSFDTVIWPFITSWTRSFSQSFPLVRSSGLWPIRPSSAIRSRMERLSAATSGWGCGSALSFVSVAILGLLSISWADPRLRAGPPQQLLTLDHLLKKVVQFFIPDERTPKVG